jgi:hypothetical protein
MRLLTKIFKYPIHPVALPSVVDVMIPGAPCIFKFGMDPLGTLSLWAGVYESAQPVKYQFRILGTGQVIHQGDYYLDTVIDPNSGLVYHIFSTTHIIYRHQLVEMY